MKKRLLSAALALAMVLTMLPLSALPAFAADPTDVTWYKTGATLPNSNVDDKKATDAGDGGAWYSRTAIPDTKKYNYSQVTTGVVSSLSNSSSAKHFTSIDDAIGAGWTNIKLLNNQTIGSTNFIKGATIDLNGNTLGGTITVPAKYVKDGKDVNVSSVTMTIKDSKYSGNGRNGTPSGFSVYVGESSAPKASSTIITLQNVNTAGTITAYYTTSCTVNVKGSTAGDIGLHGTSGGAVNVGDNNVAGVAGNVSIKTTGTSTGGKVTATNATLDSVDLTGVGASLTGTNADVGDVTLLGYTAGDLTDSRKSSLAAPSVTLNGGSAGTITAGVGEVLTKAHGITLNGNAAVNEIDYDRGSASVTVNNSAGGNISVKNGEVKLNGSTTGPASAGEIVLGGANSTASLTVTGSKVTTGDITASAGTVNITVPNDDTNTFGTLTSTVNVNNRGISGGVWGSAVPARNLSTSLVYQATSSASGKPLEDKFVYYAQNQFQKLIDAYQTDNDVVITLVQDGGSSHTITFKNGNDTLTVIKYSKPSMPIALPTTVNGGAVNKWTEYKADGTTLIRDLVNAAGYSTPAGNADLDRVLNAQVTDNAITKLVGVATSVPGLTVRLVDNAITLSGAIPQGTTAIQIEVTTDGNPGIKDAKIGIVYDPSNGSVRFANQTGLDGGMWVTNDWAYLVMPNDTTRYSLNGSGLKVQATSLKAEWVHGYAGDLPVIVNVTCSGTGWTNYRKQELANTMSSVVSSLGSSTAAASGLTFAGGSSKVVFTSSPAVQEALNAVVAGISDSQVSSWLLNAQNAAWRKTHNTTPSANERGLTGYNEVHVVAYMAVTISNYNTANDPGTLTMTLIPSYYVEVTGTGGNPVSNPDYQLLDTVSSQLNARRPVSGRALGSLTGDVGAIELTLKKEDAFNTTVTPVAHQNNTYAYPTKTAGSLVFDITHAINSSLGTFVINGDAALVKLYSEQPTPPAKPSDDKLKGSYDTLQAAVDDAENGWYIDVDSNYKGSCNISVTGEARKFQINTNGANRVTSNVTGVVTEKTSGTLYEVQLERSTQPTTNATVTVNTAGNGSATLNVSNAKPGTTVSGTYKANKGYKAGTFTATAKTADGNKSVTVNVKADGTFTFTVPANATSVTVTPNFVADTGLPFTDVAASAWYFDGVKYCYNTTKNGYRVMEGFSSTQFGADRAYTRAEVVTILWNLKGRPTPGAATRTYTDVNSGHWAYNAIVWATNNGYAEGYPNGSFQPSSSVTREEMVVFLWRAARKPTTYNSINLNGYTDGYNVHDWGLSAMKWAVALNILSGQNSVSLNGTLAARTTAYRREVAVTIMNFDKLNLF